MLTNAFLTEFKRITESNWSVRELRPDIYGFQFQRGTHWNPGISEEGLSEYQKTLGFEFPNDFKMFLRTMNGTDLSTVNLYGNCGEPSRTSVGVYSFPRDIERVQRLIVDIHDNRSEIADDLADQGFNLPNSANLLPIFAHRYVICASDPATSVVLSVVVHDVDAIVYADSLQEYLVRDFLGEASGN